jgi:hypothetical protein
MKRMKIMKTTMKNYIILLILSLTIPAYAQVITNGKRIHELPAKDTIKSDYLIIQGSPTTGKLYKTKMSVLNSAYSGGVGGSTDTSSLSNRIDKKLNKTDTSTLSNRINAKEAAITATTSADYYRGDKTFQALNKSAVGLSNVDNTSDATKNSATSTLTNKTISGSANTFSNISESSVTNLVSDLAAKESTITAGSTSQYWRGDKTWQTLTIPAQFNPTAGSNITLTGTYPNITIASSGGGGGGGGETLDQTLALGNTTDTLIIFDKSIASPSLGNAVTHDWLIFNPLVQSTNYSSTFGFKESATLFGVGSANDAIDHVMMWGWNISAGGGLESTSVVAYANVGSFPGTGNYNVIYKDNSNSNELARYYNWNGSSYTAGVKRGKTGIGFSLEDRYNQYNDGSMATEGHEFYIDPLGKQIRLKSYTINTTTNSVDLYRTVSREYLYVPTAPGHSANMTQYWEVEPGSNNLKSSDDLQYINTYLSREGGVLGTGNKDHGITSNSDRFFFNVGPVISFSGATLSNASLSSINVANTTISYADLTSNIKLHTFNIESPTPSKYFQADPQDGANALAWYGYGGMNSFQLQGGITDFRSPYMVNFWIGGRLRVYTNSTNSFIMGSSDLDVNIGYDGGQRINSVFAKQYYLNTKSSDPSTSDVEAGYYSMYKNTTSGAVKLWVNDGGTMKSVTLN